MEVASVLHDKRSASHGRKRQSSASNAGRVAILAAILVALYQCLPVQAQVAPGRPQAAANPNQASPPQERESELTSQPDAETELQTGTTLTRKGLFREAIPHLLAARGRVANEYAASFNLALCYAGTGQPAQAIEVLNGLRSSGHDGVDVENLLAQAYIGNAQPQLALASLKQAATLSPQNEKLYVFVAEACRDHKDYGLGLTVIDIGLRNLPQSARLHYERAMFLVQLDQLDQAKPDFDLVSRIAPGDEIAYLAAAHEKLLEGDIPRAIRTAREGVRKGYENAVLLTVLGEALIRSGVTPGQPEFAEAQAALEKAVTQRPNDPTSQIALGSIDLMAGHLDDAITHLERARQLDPGLPSVYANLAKAYQRHGDVQQSHDALAALEKLNREQAERISSAPGDRKLGYAGRAVTKEESATAPPQPAHR
jgi:tetratricopeptide (TPR) repeat protein